MGTRECSRVAKPWSTALPTSAMAAESGREGSEPWAVRRGLWRLRQGGVGMAWGRWPEAGGGGSPVPGAAEEEGEQI